MRGYHHRILDEDNCDKLKMRKNSYSAKREEIGFTTIGMRVENHKREYPSSVRMNNNQGLTLHGDKL